jgi:hypothetical protein
MQEVPYMSLKMLILSIPSAMNGNSQKSCSEKGVSFQMQYGIGNNVSYQFFQLFKAE